MKTTKNNKQVLVNFVNLVAFVSERTSSAVGVYGS